MKPDASPADLEAVRATVRGLGLTPYDIDAESRAIAVAGAGDPPPAERFSGMRGVAECVSNGETPRLVLRGARPHRTTVTVRGETIGGSSFAVIAGPCAVKSRDQVMRIAEVVSECGIKFFRGGAFKPRTSPYAFQGLRELGLRLLDEVRSNFDLRLVTEAKDTETLPAVADVADVVQIGSRNMHNYSLLEAAGRLRKPVLLKRGISATIQEWLLAAEYLLVLGNEQVVLCERGIRTFEPMTRNTLDLAGAIVASHHTHLPVIVDPSHGVGMAWAVPALARAATVSGVDGVMLEVHPDPGSALSDGQQALDLKQFRKIAAELRELSAWSASHK